MKAQEVVKRAIEVVRSKVMAARQTLSNKRLGKEEDNYGTLIDEAQAENDAEMAEENEIIERRMQL